MDLFPGNVNGFPDKFAAKARKDSGQPLSTPKVVQRKDLKPYTNSKNPYYKNVFKKS
jgi:hypothetical protein